MRVSRHPLAIAAVVGGSLVLAACGGDSDDTTVSPAAEETATDAGVESTDEMTEEMADEATDAAGSEGAAQAAGGAAAVAAVLPGSGTPPPGFDPATVSGATVAGGTFDAATVEGPIIYWAWAPWCTVCLAESSEIAEAVAATEGQITFVGVAGLAPQEDMVGFVEDTGLGNIDHLADVDGQQWAALGIAGQPSFVIVDAEGQAVSWAGALGGELLGQVTAALTA